MNADGGWAVLDVLALSTGAALAGLVRGFSGFGAGLLLAPLYSLWLGPARGVPITVLLELVATLRLAPEAWPDVRYRTVLALGLPACVTVPLGSVLLVELDPTLVRRAIGLCVLALVVALSTGWRYRGRPALPLLLATGGTSGLLSGAGGVGGPPVVLLLLGGPDSARLHRATLIAFFALTQTVAALCYAAAGLLGNGVWLLALVLAPVFWLGTHAGSRLFARAHERSYRWLVLGFLAVVALACLV